MQHISLSACIPALELSCFLSFAATACVDTLTKTIVYKHTYTAYIWLEVDRLDTPTSSWNTSVATYRSVLVE
ncbi:hypothetical protein F5X97DRAFT_63021 [Nemania serpens]|nr:hypothetical protein F5X97DRAFT_63021 [Nemania serpens]